MAVEILIYLGTSVCGQTHTYMYTTSTFVVERYTMRYYLLCYQPFLRDEFVPVSRPM